MMVRLKSGRPIKRRFTLRDRVRRDLNLDAAKIKCIFFPSAVTSAARLPSSKCRLLFLGSRTGKAVKMVLDYSEELAACSHRTLP